MKATSNYERIAEGLSRSLLEITEAVQSCTRECFLYRTKAMQHDIADLYAHIFLFLRDTLNWYTKKSIRRVLSSLKEDFYDHFEDQIANIQRISNALNRKAQHASQSELRYTRLLVEDVSRNQRLALGKDEREAAERRYQEQKALMEREREAQRAELLEQEQSRRLEELGRSMCASFKSICIEEATRFLANINFNVPGIESGRILSAHGTR